MGALLQMNMYLIIYSHQITIYQDMQSSLNYNLQYFCFQYFQPSGEPILPKDRYLLLVYPLRTWPQLLEQKGTQNLTRSGLCPYFPVLPRMTILPLLFMLMHATVTDRNYLQYLSCWKTKPSEKPMHWSHHFQYLILQDVVSSLTWKWEVKRAPPSPLISGEEEGISWTLCRIRSHIINAGLNLQATKIVQAMFLDT